MPRPHQAEDRPSREDLDARFYRWANVIGLDARLAADVISLSAVEAKPDRNDAKVISVTTETASLRKAA